MEKGPRTHGSGMHDNASMCPHAKASEYQEDSYLGSKYLIVLPTNPSPLNACINNYAVSISTSESIQLPPDPIVRGA